MSTNNINNNTNTRKTSEAIFIICLSLAATVLSMIVVIVNWARTPKGFTFQFIGTFFPDFFEYVQAISQGANGSWLATPGFVGINTVIPQFWPYIITGKITSLLNIRPVFGYWLSHLGFTFSVIILIYLIISKSLKEKPFYLKLFAFLFVLSATPFFKIIKSGGGSYIVQTYDYWYNEANFFTRFGPIPYHTLGKVLSLTVVLAGSWTIGKLTHLSKKKIVIYAVLISLITTVSISFTPFSTLITFIALEITAIVFLLRTKFRHRNHTFRYMAFMLLTSFIVIALSLILRHIYQGLMDFVSLSNMEMQWQQPIEIGYLLLNIGPLIIFAPFGIYDYFKKITPLRIFVFVSALISYGLTISKLSLLLGTHNLRFLSGNNYIFWGMVAVLGMMAIVKFIFKSGKKVFVSMALLLFGIFVYININFILPKINDGNIFCRVSYVPNQVIDGFYYLRSLHSDKTVLTAPSGLMSMVLNSYTNSKILVSRYTGGVFEERANLAVKFYQGIMGMDEATSFFRKYNIGYVVLTSVDDYPVGPLIDNYSFLQQVYRNRDIVIFGIKKT